MHKTYHYIGILIVCANPINVMYWNKKRCFNVNRVFWRIKSKLVGGFVFIYFAKKETQMFDLKLNIREASDV